MVFLDMEYKKKQKRCVCDYIICFFVFVFDFVYIFCFLKKITAPSNRRLNVGDTVQLIKMQWSIDKITIVGKLKEDILYQTDNGTIFLERVKLVLLILII